MSFLDMPSRMKETWEWTCALVAFDYGDSEPLGLLIRGAAIPIEFVSAVSDIVVGRRKPNLKAVAQSKIPASERMKIAGSISVVLGLSNLIRTRLAPARQGFKSGLEEVADRHRQEPIEIVRKLQAKSRQAIEDAATELDVSVETIENLLREFRNRIKAWPAV